MRRERERMAGQVPGVRRGFLDQRWGINRKDAEDAEEQSNHEMASRYCRATKSWVVELQSGERLAKGA